MNSAAREELSHREDSSFWCLGSRKRASFVPNIQQTILYFAYIFCRKNV